MNDMPILYEQCTRVYNAMKERAEVLDIDPPAYTWKGYTTYLIEELGLTVSVYTPVMRRLQAMGCIAQVTQGGRGSPSVWNIFDPPTVETFRGTSGARHSRVKELEERVEALEGTVEELRKAM
jgi:hypothetical protein